MSGVLQPQITNSLYTFDVGASGYDANNNDPATINQGDIVLLSGVSGVHVDFETRYAGGQRSGIFVIGYDPTITYAFNAVASGNGGQNNTPKSMVNDSVLAISGVSGINIDFENRSDGTNESGVFVLGFTEEYWSKASGEGNYSQILENTASGLAISGISEWASGEFGRLGLGGGTKGTSGIIFQDDHLILDPQGSGSLARLNLNDNNSVIIQTEDGYEFFGGNSNSVIVGESAGSGSVDLDGSVVIGSGAGQNSYCGPDVYSGPWAGSNNVLIGSRAGAFSSGDAANYGNVVAVGNAAGSGGWNATDGVFVGGRAGSNIESSTQAVCIGSRAGETLIESPRSISIGWYAGRNASGINDSVNIGWRAGSFSDNCTNAINIGGYAGYTAENNSQSVILGDEAGSYSNNNYRCVMVGWDAGRESASGQNEIYIGANAGLNASGDSAYNIYIGQDAGRGRVGSNSIMIHKGNVATDNLKADHDRDDLLVIGDNILGIEDSYLHIGYSLVNDKDQSLFGTLNTAALNLTPHSTTKSALYLRPLSSQSSSLMKTKSLYGATYFDTNIINKNGQLLVQVANSKSGNEILTTGGSVIPRATAGQIALYETVSNTGIAILVQDGGALTWRYLELGFLP